MTLNFDGWPWKTIGHLFCTTSSFVHHFKATNEFKLALVRKHSIRVKIPDFLSRATLRFDGWPWKTIGHLFYTMSSFVHHFKAIGGFKLELLSRNAQFRSKLAIFCRMWSWNLMVTLKPIEHLFYATSSFGHHFKAMDEFKLELQSGNAQFGSNSAIFCHMWPWNLMDDLKNNRAPLLCYVKLCASFSESLSCILYRFVCVWFVLPALLTTLSLQYSPILQIPGIW